MYVSARVLLLLLAVGVAAYLVIQPTKYLHRQCIKRTLLDSKAPRVQISATDYIKSVPVRNFKAAWDELDPESEVSGTYALGTDTGGVPSAVEAMISHMGMYVAEGTDLVVPNARSHMLMLSGELCGGHKALLRISFGVDARGSVAIKVVTRAADQDISEVLDQIVQSM